MHKTVYINWKSVGLLIIEESVSQQSTTMLNTIDHDADKYDHIRKENKSIFVMGDFNINLLNFQNDTIKEFLVYFYLFM